MVNNSESSRPEFRLINWIRSQSRSDPRIPVGIGDDAAVFAEAPGKQWVTTVDVLTEGIHFTSETPPELIGRKSLAVNLSDLAAMAAEPVAAFIGLVLPRTISTQDVESLYSGMFQLANEYNTCIAGGDTNSWDGPLVISVTLQGLVPTGKAVLRSGARVGDEIFVTGALGGSLQSGRHFSFLPRIAEAQMIAKQFRPTAMLDLSDGLGSDIHHLANRSEVGIRIDGNQIPIHDDVPPNLDFESRLNRALNDGEDFELLFTVNSDTANDVLRKGCINGRPVTRIGVCVAERGVELVTGTRSQKLTEGGWSHNFGT